LVNGFTSGQRATYPSPFFDAVIFTDIMLKVLEYIDACFSTKQV